MRKRDIKHNYLVGSISIGLLSLVAMALLCPSVDRTSYAVDCAPGEEPCTTTQAEAGIDLTVASTVSVALQNLISLEVTPKTSGAFTESTAKLTVATNNPSGYAVYMQAGSTTNGKASLVSSDLSNTAMINPVSGTVENNSFSANTWGYSLDGTHYQAVPATTGIIKETSSTTFSDTYDLSFGVNVDTNLPAGQYTNSVIVSAVANPIKVTSLSQLNYMQDMTTDICTNTAEHVTKQLIDTRDGKPYWVAKLKDGNCWMTQNLALDLSTSKTLTPADTDVIQNYTPTSGTNEIDYTDTSSSSVEQYSWSFGAVVLATPLELYEIGADCTYTNEISGEELAKVCREFGIIDVSTPEWQPIFSAQAGVFNGKNYNLIAADENNQTYDSHYLLGNYYQFNTATAGSVAEVATGGVNAENSICPKNWRLAQAGSSPITIENNDFYALVHSYGYPDIENEVLLDIINPTIISPSNPASTPIYLTRSGSFQDGTFIVGRGASIWSSTVNSIYNGRRIHLNEHQISFTASITRNRGYSVRCLAR